ncbi:hypothetical protein A3F27_00555 [Candidatus Kaiserbacteria bacterium RIFCSPHIGHO2_12_FULL_53_13]|uniref:Polymerase nucleotidyl transferase domain-containing protein n=1 Tax=Candidatus Kaiserbacteria bacterium RIFCSPHIGHO2_12_FULL_53_13 TaxID=1798502 RepID=A0A1F6E7A6_9BACT|nr:MAG: hypothetical protein A3F27_00555 [Candidatus Kaiserbacteria bacterium RIFCSPHIGHO2_12_FULL_53_13]OGG74451.1 MAG: hypothetical protein A3A37_02260 [Candidatus Kaiserbacteria bacterium RIFCSPLOWO2_01_FULL_52_36]
MRDSPRRLEDLEGASKRKRLDKINESGILESKRFLLSPDPILRERPRILADIIERLRIKHPEIIGVVFGGSYVKGYANSKSDLDASIFIDEDSVRDAAGTNDPDEKTEKLQYFLDIRKDIQENVRSANLPSRGLLVCLTSKNKIIKACKTGSFSENLVHMFRLAAGKGIYEYRELAISTLEQIGKIGEKRWSELMLGLLMLEWVNSHGPILDKRQNLYPKTLAEGRKYFVEHKPWRAEKS